MYVFFYSTEWSVSFKLSSQMSVVGVNGYEIEFPRKGPIALRQHARVLLSSVITTVNYIHFTAEGSKVAKIHKYSCFRFLHS